MKLKRRTVIVLIGIILTMIGLGGIGYEFFDHIEIIEVKHKAYPLGEEHTVIKNQYSEVDEIKLNVHNYNVEFLPTPNLTEVQVEVVSTNYMQNYVEPIRVNKDNNQLTVHSPHQKKLYIDDYSMPDDLLEFTQNHIVMFKYFIKEYNEELMNKKIIIPSVKEYRDFTQTIRIYYPEGSTFTDLDIKTNGNLIYINKYELNDQDAETHLVNIINGIE